MIPVSHDVVYGPALPKKTPAPDVFDKLNSKAEELAKAYALVARLLQEHDALIAEAMRVSGGVNVEEVMAVVAIYYDVELRDLFGRCRAQRFSVPRQVAIWLLLRITNLKKSEIGRMFGRHHTMVFFSEKRVNNHRDTHRAFRAETDLLLQRARGSLTARTLP